MGYQNQMLYQRTHISFLLEIRLTGSPVVVEAAPPIAKPRSVQKANSYEL